MIIRNTNPFEYYIIQQLFNDVNVPRCHTENLSYENIFILFKYTLLFFSQSYFFGYKYKGHDFFRSDAFAPVASPSATRLLPEQIFATHNNLMFFKLTHLPRTDIGLIQYLTKLTNSGTYFLKT